MRPFASLLLAVLLGCSAQPGREPSGASPSKSGKSGDCRLECLRWSEQCNVDPRGVYRCQHVCERFGEHCE